MSIVFWGLYLVATVADESVAKRLGETFALIAVALWAYMYSHARR